MCDSVLCVLRRQGPCWGRPRWTPWSSWRTLPSASEEETWGCGRALASDACRSWEVRPWRARWPWCPETKYLPGETNTESEQYLLVPTVNNQTLNLSESADTWAAFHVFYVFFLIYGDKSKLSQELKASNARFNQQQCFRGLLQLQK